MLRRLRFRAAARAACVWSAERLSDSYDSGASEIRGIAEIAEIAEKGKGACIARRADCLIVWRIEKEMGEREGE